MDDGVWILGGYQSDFARNLSKENRDFADLTREVVDGTLTAAKVDAADLAAAGVVHVANAFGEMFARQGHLGAMPATVCDDLWDTPATRHAASCRVAGGQPSRESSAWAGAATKQPTSKGSVRCGSEPSVPLQCSAARAIWPIAAARFVDNVVAVDSAAGKITSWVGVNYSAQLASAG